MKRGGRLKTKTRLRRKTRLRQGGGLAKGAGLARGSRLKQRGQRKRRERSAEDRFRREVLEAAGGICQRCGSVQDVEAHHLAPRGRNSGHPLLHDKRNGAALCWECHDEVHHAKDCHDRTRWLKPAGWLDKL